MFMDRQYTVKGVGGEAVTFYPLTVKHIRTMPEEMKALMNVQRGDDPFAPERFAKLMVLWLASARRGKPDATEEEVESVITLSHMLKIARTLLDQDDPDPVDDLK